MKKYLNIILKKIVSKKAYFCYVPVLVVLILFTLIPLFDLTKQALTNQDPYNYQNQSFGIESFEHVFADERFNTAISNTLLLLFGVSPILMIIFFAIALAINKLAFRIFKTTFLALLFSQLFISSYSIGISFLVLFDPRTNVLNTIFNTTIDWNNPNAKFFPLLHLIIFYTWTTSALSILLFVIGISRINQNKILMSQVDNLGFVKQIWFIYIPNLKRIIYLQIYIFLFQALFFYPTIYEDPFALNCQTLAIYIIDNFHFKNSPLNWSLAAAASIVLIIISFFTITLFVGTRVITKWWKIRSQNVHF